MQVYAHADKRVRPRELVGTWKKAKRKVLVYYDDSCSSPRALNAALDALDGNTEVTAVAFVPIPLAQSLLNVPDVLKTRANVYLAAAVANARQRGLEIKTEIIAGYSLEEALTGFAMECGAERVFVGRDLERQVALDRLAYSLLEFGMRGVTFVG